jgi:hypothetical protein
LLVPAPANAVLEADLLKKIDEATDEAYAKTLDALSKLHPEAYLANLFKNLVKCKQVKETIGEVVGVSAETKSLGKLFRFLSGRRSEPPGPGDKDGGAVRPA